MGSAFSSLMRSCSSCSPPMRIHSACGSLMRCCSDVRFLLFLILVTSSGMLVMSTVPQVHSVFATYFCVAVWVVLFWMFLCVLPTQGQDQREEDEVDERRERREQREERPRTQVVRVGFAFDAAQRSPIEYREIRPLPFGRRALIARLAMRALPPVKSFAGDETAAESPRKCPVCLEEFKNGEIVQPFGVCVHEFHSSCINSWLLGGKTTCPVCRKDLSAAIGT